MYEHQCLNYITIWVLITSFPDLRILLTFIRCEFEFEANSQLNALTTAEYENEVKTTIQYNSSLLISGQYMP